jgi:hypothetical protein
LGEVANPADLLKAARTILLIDWPNPEVPLALLGAGFTVFGFSPKGYSSIEFTLDPPSTNVDSSRLLLSDSTAKSGLLTFRRLGGPPSSVDIIAVYRPVEELPGIIAGQVRPLGATVLWLQPPAVSAEARQMAATQGVKFVEGVDIAVTARALAAPPSVRQ